MREAFGSVDAAWLRMDRPENTADVVALLAFRALPPAERLRALVADRLVGAAPRLRQRVARGSALGGDAWIDDDAFSLDRHVVTQPLRARGAGALGDLVGEVATEPLDPGRPLWRLHLVDGPGQGAIVAKVHHCVADGFALVGLLLSLADARRGADAAARHALPAARRLAPWLDPAGAVRAALRDRKAALDLALRGGAVAAALARMAALPADPPSALTRPLVGRRRAAWSGGLPLAAVRAAARGRGATVNDLLVAAVAGAVRGWLAAAGDRVDGLTLRALVPVNLRAAAPAPGEPLGNRFGLAFLDLPVGEAALEARAAAVRAAGARLRDRPDAVAAYAALAAIGRAPALTGTATRFFSRKASLVITNVPGPREPLHVGGSRLEHAMFWVPHPATLGVGVSILSYAGEVRIGVRADVGVMPEPADLVRRFEAELAALGVVAGPAEPSAAPAAAAR